MSPCLRDWLAWAVIAFSPSNGGDIRGALSITLIRRLHERFPDFVQSTDLFAGTSTGSFIALGLAYGLPPDRIAELYAEPTARFVFTSRHLELFRPKYNNDHLRQVLESVFPPDLRLEDLPHRVLIPSFRVSPDPNTGGWSPVFFNNLPDSPTREARVLDVALSSSAAPVYFPSYQHYVDGGVVANNPAVAAIAFARNRNLLNQCLDDIVLLSVGTGFYPQAIRTDTSGWGALAWMLYPEPPLPLLSVLMDGVLLAHTQMASQLLGEAHFRLDPILPELIPLDAYEKIPLLVQLGEQFDLGPVSTWITQHWL